MQISSEIHHLQLEFWQNLHCFSVADCKQNILALRGEREKKRGIYVTFCIKVKKNRKVIIRRQQEFLSVQEKKWPGASLPTLLQEPTINARVLGIKVD